MIRPFLLIICLLLPSFSHARIVIEEQEQLKECDKGSGYVEYCGNWKYLHLVKDSKRDRYNKPGVQKRNKRWYTISKKKVNNAVGRIVLEGVVFKTGTSELLPGSMEALKKDAWELKQEAPRPFDIIGNADARGTDSYNQKLSQARAKKIYDIFVKEGINPSRMNAVGHGESRPIDSNYTRMGQTRNRRIEIFLYY